MSEGTIVDKFQSWLTRHTDELKDISEMLSTRLSNEPEELYDTLTLLESHNDTISRLYSDAESWVPLAKHYFLNDHIDKIAYDKKIAVEADVASFEKVFTRLKLMKKDMETKLDAGRSLLAYSRERIIRQVAR